MGFYSALVLAANTGVSGVSSAAVESLLDELKLRKPTRSKYSIGNLTDDIADLFSDPAAFKENNRFFHPDTISFMPTIEISDYRSAGSAVVIHGQGYLWPWTIADLREKVIRTPKLVQLRCVVGERFGGSFLFEGPDESNLRQRLIDGSTGWAWFVHDEF